MRHQEERGIDLLISGMATSQIYAARSDENTTTQLPIVIVTRRRSRWTITMSLLALLLLLLPMDGAVSAKQWGRLKRRKVSTPVDDGPFSQIRIRYNRLTPNGKLAVGFSAGFIGSRLTFTTVTGLAKAGAVAFVAAEGLKMIGVLDDLKPSEEQMTFLTRTRINLLRTTEDYRMQIRRRWNGRRHFFETERMTAIGLGCGIVLGSVL